MDSGCRLEGLDVTLFQLSCSAMQWSHVGGQLKGVVKKDAAVENSFRVIADEVLPGRCRPDAARRVTALAACKLQHE